MSASPEGLFSQPSRPLCSYGDSRELYVPPSVKNALDYLCGLGCSVRYYRPCLKLWALYCRIFRNQANDPGHTLFDACCHNPQLWQVVHRTLYAVHQYPQWDDPEILLEVSKRLRNIAAGQSLKPKAQDGVSVAAVCDGVSRP